MADEFDLVVLGGGTGGYIAAIRASQLGMNVAVVEKEKLGGTCLHKGCIPSKSLLKSASAYRETKELSSFGVELGDIQFNLVKAMERKNEVVDKLHGGINYLMKKHHVTVINGYGRILGPSIFSPMPGTISIEHEGDEENTMIVPKNVLIATGSKPRLLPGLNISQNILTSTEALALTQLPKSIIIIGAGAIGIEWASMLVDLDVDVTVVEQADSVLPGADLSIQKELQQQLEKRGVTFYLGSEVQIDTVEDTNEKTSLVVVENGKSIQLESEKILVSIGRTASIEGIGIENTSIEVADGFIQTNEFYQTKEKHIYAIGDCIGGLQLAHVASTEGIRAVEHMNGLDTNPLDLTDVPTCVYSYPEVASVGLTEQEAKNVYEDIAVGISLFQANGKAMADGDTTGFVKVIQDKQSDDVVGVHMIGNNVTNQISELALAKTLDASVWELSQVIRPHPSQSEALTEAALAVKNLELNS